MDRKVYLVLNDQYAKVDGSFAATYSDTAVEAAFSDEAKARAFIEEQSHKNQFGPLYWRVQEFQVDVKSGFERGRKKGSLLLECEEEAGEARPLQHPKLQA